MECEASTYQTTTEKFKEMRDSVVYIQRGYICRGTLSGTLWKLGGTSG